MRLISVTPVNMGPFYGDETAIPIEEELTVLTGANDVGKSLLLKVISLAFRYPEPSKDEVYALVNSAYRHEQHQPVEALREFGCDAVLEITQSSKNAPGTIGTRPKVKIRWSPSTTSIVQSIRTPDGKESSLSEPLKDSPLCLTMPVEGIIGDHISLENPNPAQIALLRAAFGAGYDYQKLLGYSPAHLDTEVLEAQDRLNQGMARIVPGDVQLSARLSKIDNRTLGFHLRDLGGALTPFSFRGAGLQLITKHLAVLLSGVSRTSQDVVVLFDEPEASLHADLQHALRGFLEEVAAQPNVQVVYATHSPSMINSLFPTTVRLLEKKAADARSTSQLVPNPFDQNWYSLREGLGLTPADSLLYGDITAVVEGITETIGIPLVVKLLADAGVPGFAGQIPLLERFHFLPGEGDSAEYFVRLGMHQRNKVVVLLDSDKQQQEAHIRAKHPEVPVVRFPEPKEFEDLVPLERYLAALASVLGNRVPTGGITVEKFEDFEKGSPPPSDKMLISKRLTRWLEKAYGASYSKPEVMHRALAEAQIDELIPNCDPIRELLAKAAALL